MKVLNKLNLNCRALKFCNFSESFNLQIFFCHAIVTSKKQTGFVNLFGINTICVKFPMSVFIEDIK